MISWIRQFAAIFSCAFLAQTISAQLPTNGLVAFYPLDGNADDASGNGLNGTASAVVATTNRFGQENSALLFDGVDSAINCGNPAAFNFSSNFTIAAWVKTTGAQINKYIVGKYDFSDPNSRHSYGLGTANNSNPYGFVQGGGPGYADAAANVNLNDENWRAIALVYNVQTGLRLYANGLVAAQGGGANYPPFINDVPLMIGRTFSGQPFGGAIDDVRIYDRALSNFEVSLLGPGVSMQITTQPNSYYAGVGGKVPLRVAAAIEGTSESVSVQWFRNGVAVPGLTNLAVTVTSLDEREDIYQARLTLGNIEQFSNEATVTFAFPSDAGLLARYTFDDDTDGIVVDETGNFPGTATNVVYAPGRQGSRSIRFNGTNAFVRIPYPASPLDLAGTPYTITFWMKLDSPVTTGQQLISMSDPADNVGGYAASTSATQFTWLHNSGSDNSLVTSVFRPGANWNHIAMVWNGFTRTLYTNGVMLASIGTTNGIVSERNDDLYFGSRGGTNFLRGSLDDVRIFNYALAGDEIVQMQETTPTVGMSISVGASNLLLSWPLVDGAYYRVEFANSVGVGSQWNPVSGIAQRVGNIFTLSQPTPQSSRFYRLRKL